ncbi:MAG: haloacid dehalogenase [Akkermansiaceae bacterium]|nr:haloacid dehalogenase [Armatimonadota bacterium]
MEELPLAHILNVARATLDEKYRARETALAHGRALTRTCANAIRAMHRGEFDEARTALNGARAETARIADALSSHPDLFFAGYVQDAHKELAEAENLLALMRREPLPTPQSLCIETAAFLNGLAEAASEGRRFALDRLRRGDVTRASAMLEAMDEILSALTTLDYPDAVTGGLRRTCDALRAVVERTRGDVTMAALQERLLKAIPTNGAVVALPNLPTDND